jgi:predicted acyl esterase
MITDKPREKGWDGSPGKRESRRTIREKVKGSARHWRPLSALPPHRAHASTTRNDFMVGAATLLNPTCGKYVQSMICGITDVSSTSVA